MSDSDTVPCPYCHRDMPAKAKACPHCGSDEQTGWSSETYLDGIDLPGEEEYEEMLREEFEPDHVRFRVPVWQWVVAAGLTALFALGFLRSCL